MTGAPASGRRFLLVVTACAGLFASAYAAARNVALLIAVGNFADRNMEENYQLMGTAADIVGMQKVLTERWKFDPKDVVVIKDKDATHDRVLAELSAIEQRSAAGDTVLVYYSGHGTSDSDEDNQFDLPYATGAWFPYDFNPDDANRTLIVGRRDLVPRLKRLDQGGRWVVVVSDSCFSGQVVRRIGQKHAHTRYIPLRKRDLGVASSGAAPAAASGPRKPPPPYPYQHVVLLSGASDSETGNDISSSDLRDHPTFDGQPHGAFTDVLLRLLNGQLMPGTYSYAQARERLSSLLEQEHFAQHPQLLPAIAEDPDDVGSNQFLSATHGATGSGPVGEPTKDATVHVRLESVSPALQASIGALKGVSIVGQDAELTVRQTGQQVQLLGPAGDPISSTVASDPKLLDRIAGQAWISRVVPAGSDKLGLRAETDPGSRGNTFVECESFVFEVRLQKPAYLMVLDLDSQGQLTLLFPTRASERQIVPSGKARAIPGSDPKDHIVVTPPFGMDEVSVIAFEQAQDFLAAVNGAEPFSISSPRADSLARGLAHINGAFSVQRVNVNTYPGNPKKSCGS
jgi:Caspase domain/Domain of unknown function (DUF4384)